VDLYTRLRTRRVLHRAWAQVRSSGLSSDSENTKHDTRQFEANWLNNLENIARQLKNDAFAFTGEKGVTPSKGKGKRGVRPLVVAPIANRIVRRAILDVLQGDGETSDNPRHRWAGVPAVREIMATRTSVGGIRQRGVPHGLALIDYAVRADKHWFVRSDIRNFFTRIRKSDVIRFIRNAVNDDKFVNLFEQALATNLVNHEELEERHLFKLFPDPKIGVAQGSALSALAGNIALREFDTRMNDLDIVCVRYIDDFILLGPSEAKVHAAYKAARRMLKAMGMEVYDLNDAEARKDDKVDDGNIHNGTNVLGYRISGTSLQPSARARKKFLEKLDKVVKDCKRAMNAAVDGTSCSHNARYHQSMVQLHEIVWGWSQSFRHTTAKHVFEGIDKEIDKRINMLKREACRQMYNGDIKTRRRISGIHLLVDTAKCPLPEAYHNR